MVHSSCMDIALVKHEQNWANNLTKGGFMENEIVPIMPLCAASVEELKPIQIMNIHQCSSYIWVRWTIELLRIVSASRLSTAVKCGECQSVDPTLIYWQKGKNYKYLTQDIIHQVTATSCICGQTLFLVLQLTMLLDYVSIMHQLMSVFYKTGPPHKLLTDDDMVFWNGVSTYASDVHTLTGNKRIAAI